MKKFIKWFSIIILSIVILLGVTYWILCIPVDKSEFSGKPTNLLGIEIERFQYAFWNNVRRIVSFGHESNRNKID